MGFWPETEEGGHKQGWPRDVYRDTFFGFDRVREQVEVSFGFVPGFEEQLIEETDEYRIYTTRWGATQKDWKHAASTPEFLDFTIVDPGSWATAKELIQPTRDRVNWEVLRRNYAAWRQRGDWIEAGLWFGFDVIHSWMIGTERMLMAMIEHPEWVKDMIGHLLDVHLQLLDMIWAEGYTFDSVRWPDDMGYKYHTFFSLDMYREIVLPFQQKAIDWAHAKGIRAHLHSCGDIHTFVPDLVAAGLDALNPLEVKAGMDPIALKREFGDRLVLHGGINAVLWDRPAEIRAEMERVLPVVKENGGYIFSSDHSVPSSVSLEDFRGIVELAKRLGSYE